jgi:hypothetical protein
MTKADLVVERSAQRLQHLADKAAARGDGVGEWLAEELRDDAAFLRKLKPSLIKARAKGQAAKSPEPEAPSPSAPSSPQLGKRPKKKRRKGGRGGPPPIAIVGAAFVAGIVLAKVISWRGSAGD